MESIFYEYIIYFPDETIRRYRVDIDKKNRRIINTSANLEDDVEWTDLEHCQCENCPLNKNIYPKCPVAHNLYSLIEVFNDQISFEEVSVEIISDQRTYKKDTTLQIALQSLFGILMAASDCPNMNFLSSMALFHLPFASFEETILRAASFYLLKQYFQKRNNLFYDYSMDGLKKQYEAVEKVNQGLLERIQSIETEGDASLNAITTLNAFAQMFSLQYELDLASIQYIFSDLNNH
ncbi:hypothetical protein MHK_000880 [Candidatus Magnetomorum sp. HK-1]|nr:hypothetical protein MHK_000880 [Candidatus Magnetomorum sp. HK-1]